MSYRAHSWVDPQAIYQQSSKEEAKQKEVYETKISQNGTCKARVLLKL